MSYSVGFEGKFGERIGGECRSCVYGWSLVNYFLHSYEERNKCVVRSDQSSLIY